MEHQKRKQQQKVAIRKYRSHGVEVEVRETKKLVELTLDGKPIHVSIIAGEYHCQLANQFTAFASVDHIVETLLANHGRTWTLDGHVCDEDCGEGGHHGDSGGHVHVHGHEHGGGQ